MRVLTFDETEAIRLRLLECDCGLDGCESVFVVAQVPGGHEELWLGMGVARDFASALAAAESVLANPMLEFRTTAQMIERGMALVGLGWPAMLDHDALTAQLHVWCALPEWMERQPAGALWGLRGVCFGRDLTRVPRALYATAKCYVPEGPKPYEDFEQDRWWGVHAWSFPVELWVSRDTPAREAFADWSDA